MSDSESITSRRSRSSASSWDDGKSADASVASTTKRGSSLHFRLHHSEHVMFTRISGRWDETPVAASSSRWDSSASTPVSKGGAAAGGRSRWDETPVAGPPTNHKPQTANPLCAISGGGATPVGGFSMMTPTPSQLAAMTPEQYVPASLNFSQYQYLFGFINEPLQIPNASQ